MNIEQAYEKRLALQRRPLTFLLSKNVPPLPLQEERKTFPHYRTNPLYRCFFWYLTPLLRVGYKRTLQPEDLFVLDEQQTIDYMYTKFKSTFEPEVQKLLAQHIARKCQERGETPATSSVSPEDDADDFEIKVSVLGKHLFYTFGWQYSRAAFVKVLADIAATLMPLLQKKLVDFVETRGYGANSNTGKGVGYAIGACAMILFSGICINHYFYNSITTGAKVKAVLTKALLEKSFKLDARGKHRFPVGKINSIMGTDLARVDLAIGFFPFLFIFPVPVIIVVVMLIVNIGVSALAGLAVFVFFTLFTGFLIRYLFRLRVSANVFTDQRVNLIKELLKNFKMIKLYGWENSYLRSFQKVRSQEMSTLFKMQGGKNVLIGISLWMPLAASMVAFLVLHNLKSGRSVGDIFSSLTLFQVLTQQFLLVPASLAMSSDMVIGLKRVCQLLSCPEDKELERFFDDLDDEKLAMKVENASFQWHTFEDDGTEDKNESVKSTKSIKSSTMSEEQEVVEKESHERDELSKTDFPGLLNLNLSIKKGDFVVVTGSVGSGKSSLLNALCGFMPKTEGRVCKNGSVMLCGVPWVQNATVKDNITFGRPFDQEKYDKVVKVCSLKGDFDQLPGGELTEVGERGITLSGGQKARINLARAVYADRDIIMLDDVLSAVDAKVGKFIMDECILGYLKDKTRILATHQLSLIGSADKIMFLNGDGSVDCGTFAELRSRNTEFVRLMEFSHDVEKDDDEEMLENEKKGFFDDEDKGKLVQAEEKAVNAISWKVYKSYINTGSGKLKVLLPMLFFLVIALTTFLTLFTNNWLSFWIVNRFHRPKRFYEGLYIMFTMLVMVFNVLQFMILVYFCNRAALRLNIMAFKRVLHAPMSFMDTSPMGRVLNRFTKDTDSLDNEIQDQLRMFLNPAATIIGTLVLCIIYLPWFAIAIPFLAMLFFLVSSFYLSSSREVKRLEAVKRSVVYSHFIEALSGMDTIKAHSSTERFLKVNEKLIDDMNESYYVVVAIQGWLAISLDSVATLLCLIVSLLCCFRVFNISGAYTGLLLTYVLTIAGLLSFMLRSLTEVENQMNSVERVNYYATSIKQEAPFEIPENDPEPTWPAVGAVKFVDVSMRYREELPLAVKHLDINVQGGEKIGICGRTGAGKSSIMYCLFRLAEFEGQILIDGVDISRIGLHKLRSRLSIIPQDPVLFSGTVRSNLDPFGEHDDETLWMSLGKAGLVDRGLLPQVKEQRKGDPNLHKFHLSRTVEDDGSNFSLGEKQLIALARALVRGTKILVLDEATSSVDYETDAKVQTTITKEFSDCTVLCIAHRLKTIVKYDRILVMDKGQIAEFDTPRKLYDQKGIFRSMCNKSGVAEADLK
ncbi:hypothetical protein KL905_000464 [Ogataea polymorpha]|nr:hypothetical protein KL905_000464 [Ogataea polymorpha]